MYRAKIGYKHPTGWDLVSVGSIPGGRTKGKICVRVCLFDRALRMSKTAVATHKCPYFAIRLAIRQITDIFPPDQDEYDSLYGFAFAAVTDVDAYLKKKTQVALLVPGHSVE